MITLGHRNRLTFEPLGYEAENGGSEWDDFLVIDIEYSVEEQSVFHFRHPCITAAELAGLAKIMREFLTSKENKKTIEFIEPLIKITLEKKKYEHYDFFVTAEVWMEPYRDNDTIIKCQNFNEKTFERFAEIIKQESEKFPPRFIERKQ